VRPPNDYPTSDGKPVAETDWHRNLMNVLIDTLIAFYAAVTDVYVSGNLLVFYQRGNRRRHVSPDVFVVRGVPKGIRANYLIWEEGKAPEVVIELTSSTTRREDLETKFRLYRDVLKVKEYFLFDPRADYLDPPMQGYRLRAGRYVRIRPVAVRLPSRILGLHLERDGEVLRLFNPATGRWLPTPHERIAQAESARQQAETARRQAEAAQQQAESAQQQAESARQRAEAENERLRQELEALRRPPSEGR
jgi:Uma2 family endonuclease